VSPARSRRRLPRPPTRRAGLRWFLGAHRRGLRALAVALAVGCGLLAIRPSAPHTELVVAVARDLPSGAVLRAQDLDTIALPIGAVPTGAIRARSAAQGRALAGAVRSGEPLTDARFATYRAGSIPAGFVAATIRLADPDTTAALHVGDHIDVLGVAPASSSGTATVLASDVTIHALPTPASETDNSGGGLVVVLTTSDTAARLAEAAATSHLSVTIR
jgi:pilus assembly protein CpaB